MKPASARVAVAASGGRDSTALLHCALRMARETSGIGGVEVVALHVHHGLMPQADDWLLRVRAQALRWGARFVAHRVAGTPPPGASVEAWARDERYAALAAMAQAEGCRVVLLAHHRRDQAETWLLQALRGGGPAGLSAMPREAVRGGIVWIRPWLDLPRSAVQAYVDRHGIRHVDDASNADPRYARSRLRSRVWPALDSAFPEAEAALAGAARLAQDAAALADEVAGADLPALVDEAGALVVDRWLALTPARRRNALRAWLAGTLGAPAPATLLRRLADELPRAGAARWPAPHGELRLYRGLLRPGPVPPSAARGSEWDADGSHRRLFAPRGRAGVMAVEASKPAPVSIDLSHPGRHEVPTWGGHYRVEAVDDAGIAVERLQRANVRGRRGGERLRLRPGAPSRNLKQHWQAAGVPAWERQGPLLVGDDGTLLHVPGIGCDAAALAAAGRPQRRVTWVAADALADGAGGSASAPLPCAGFDAAARR